MAPRYPGGKKVYWVQFPPSRLALWTGSNVFYASQKFQDQPNGELLGFPDGLPTWGDWMKNFTTPVGHAYDRAAGLRYAFYLNPQPYRFAIEATEENPQPGDHPVSNVSELEDWLVTLGLHPDDRQTSPSGGWVGRLAVKAMNALTKKPLAQAESSLPGALAKKVADRPGWKAWGGEYNR